jgi:hypothetical protein
LGIFTVTELLPPNAQALWVQTINSISKPISTFSEDEENNSNLEEIKDDVMEKVFFNTYSLY